MIEVDNNKMWEAIEKLLDVADAIKVSLSKQGLQWNGKEIVSIKPELTPSEVTKEKSKLTEFERFLNEADVLHKAYMTYPIIYQVNDGKESVKGPDDLNFEYRQAYLKGYYQAKKDFTEHLNK